MAISYRAACAADVAAMDGLLGRAYADESAFTSAPNLSVAPAEIEREEWWVCIDDADVLIGAVHCGGLRRGLYANRLAVEPAQQGHGVGSRLVLESEERAAKRGLTVAYVTVASPKVTSPGWYERRGYAEVERRPCRDRYAKFPYELILMEKRLGVAAPVP